MVEKSKNQVVGVVGQAFNAEKPSRYDFYERDLVDRIRKNSKHSQQTK